MHFMIEVGHTYIYVGGWVEVSAQVKSRFDEDANMRPPFLQEGGWMGGHPFETTIFTSSRLL